MDIVEKLAARMKIAKEREEIARKYLDQGGIILTKQEAEELLAFIKLTESKRTGVASAPSAAAIEAAIADFGIIIDNMPLAEFRSRTAAALRAAYAIDKPEPDYVIRLEPRLTEESDLIESPPWQDQ